MVFREHDDRGQKRTKPTVDSGAMLQNIERIREKWEHISHAAKDHLLKESFHHQIENLKGHIAKGCLSNIPVGYWTSVNECLHEKINDLFAGAKMGPELALALLTVFFYSWNSRRSNRIKGIPIVIPLEKDMSIAKGSERKEPFGFEDFEDKPAATTNQTTEPEIKETSCDNLHKKIKQPQESIAATFGMKVVEVPRDGDCLFTSVAMAISHLFETKKERTAITRHFNSLDILTGDTKSLTFRLRSLMVNEVIQRKERYAAFLNDNTKTYDSLMHRLGHSGEISGDVGDLMIKALLNVLQGQDTSTPYCWMKEVKMNPRIKGSTVLVDLPTQQKENQCAALLSWKILRETTCQDEPV
ncbi:hypothetical protein AC249_AIPGENE825 [Exaiptasia diaphana]|nr:hypothetical protein AC249_AIPGENE825 [Exaiptasia diaphana]